jgi:hypothetical protein
LSSTLDNTLVLLIGFAGTGKYTIGRELCRRTGAKLVDNHLIANPVFTVLDGDGIAPLPREVWAKLKEIRRIVYDSIRELSPPNLGFVLTMELRENNPGEHSAIDDLEKLAAARQSLFVPIRLVCDVEELCRRVAEPMRRARLKMISVENARRKSAEDAVLNPKHANVRTIDVTAKSPSEAADAIMREVDSIRDEAGLQR